MVLGKLFSGLFKKKESLSEPAAPIPAPRVIAVTPPASSLPPRPSASNNAVANAGEFDDADLSPQQQGLGFSGEYEFIKELGKGATAVVKLCRRLHSQDSDNQTDDEYENLVALKEFKTSLLKKIKEFKREGRRMVRIVSTALDKVQVEIAIMKKLSHPNLVSLDAVLDDGSELLVLVLEYAPFGQVMVWDGDEQTYRPMLDPKILRHFPAGPAHPVQYAPNGFPEHLARMFFRELVDGLEYLHTNSICHRDLKPENILVGKHGVVKIADFGVAHFFDESAAAMPSPRAANNSRPSKGFVTNSAGTYAYMPPESLAPYSAFVADIWALGVTLYALLFGKLPYFAPDVTDLFDMIQSPQPVDVPESASVDLRELLRGLLEKDPTKRMTFADIRHHPWVVMGLAIDAVAAFQTRCHDAVEITEHDVEHALTKISSVSTITTMKVRGKKWAMKARQKTLDRNASSVSAKSEDDDVSPHDNIQAA
ncbi:hypothetical protein DYB30_008092 [Aphanomyces astaci]|uniref:Protein kinase domain-containing protein n=4 Tax=Aphanomyces astaci TaxID=112090 RepID=A0A397F899_APHAT|nr:hypothetical protein DYB30_008092 [Aphanomyces astaci]RHY68321.1 hypothetical protein DYB34_007918 [Aphanomyces astaci]RHZ11542.1 hypothetical protein DYB31_003036 [Aphanomyces astaci]